MFKYVWQKLVAFFQLVRQSALEFSNDDALKFSASLSYYTLFSLAPMLIIVIAISSVWLGQEAAEGYLYKQFEGLLGTVGALQLQEMIRNAHVSGATPMATTIGVATLIFGATGVFLEIQDSINSIWSLRAKPKRGWLRFLKNRLLSFSLIVGIGFLLLVSLVLSAMLSIVYDFINQRFGQAAWLSFVITNLLNVSTVVLLFAVVFKVLPDANLKWSDVWTGSIFTAFLFLGGKWAINYYLSHSATLSVYGAAGAVVLIVLWIYYSSAILYFGAEFTKVYANKYGNKIMPNRYAVFLEKKEIATMDATASLSPEVRKEV
ncbi:MAG: YihY/virulence factor BrkB family protein [Saprospiraceae bacterium]